MWNVLDPFYDSGFCSESDSLGRGVARRGLGSGTVHRGVPATVPGEGCQAFFMGRGVQGRRFALAPPAQCASVQGCQCARMCARL